MHTHIRVHVFMFPGLHQKKIVSTRAKPCRAICLVWNDLLHMTFSCMMLHAFEYQAIWYINGRLPEIASPRNLPANCPYGLENFFMIRLKYVTRGNEGMILTWYWISVRYTRALSRVKFVSSWRLKMSHGEERRAQQFGAAGTDSGC